MEALEGNALWESLPFVKSGDVAEVGDGIWVYGGARRRSSRWTDATPDPGRPLPACRPRPGRHPARAPSATADAPLTAVGDCGRLAA